MSVPIEHWSYSSLMSYLRNPLAWYKRYVEKVYDMPSTPSSFVGRAGHLALEHYYNGIPKEEAIALGLRYIRGVPDFEIAYGKAKRKKDQKSKRASMERSYLQAINFYLEKPPRHHVLGVEVRALSHVEGIPLPLKAVSDLVVRSRVNKKGVDIVDHKFVDTFSSYGAQKTQFVLQALFNYYTVRDTYERPVYRFIIQECKKTKNTDGSSQMKRHIINFDECKEEFSLFHRLIHDVTADLNNRKIFLPNPSDMFEGENSFDIYRLGLIE